MILFKLLYFLWDLSPLIGFIFSDLSKFVLSVTILFSYFSLFFTYNLLFFKKGNINYLNEDFYLIIYFLIVISFIFIFLNSDNNFLDILVSITSSISNLGISF